MRGFGIPQLVWAYESHTDIMARELGIDPIEFRRRNILREGRPQATGTVMRDAAIAKCGKPTQNGWTGIPPLHAAVGTNAAAAASPLA